MLVRSLGVMAAVVFAGCGRSGEVAVEITVADAQSCALSDRGNVFCWGNVQTTATFLGATVREIGSREPKLVRSDATEVIPLQSHTCVRDGEGNAFCRFDKNEEHVEEWPLVEGFAGGSPFRTNDTRACAVLDTGVIRCVDGARPAEDVVNPPLVPFDVRGIRDVETLFLGHREIVVRQRGGEVVGRSFGQSDVGLTLGGLGLDREEWHALDMLANARDLRFGSAPAAGYAIALDADGTVRMWGRFVERFSGRDEDALFFHGDHVDGLSGITQIAAGHQHACALRGDGRVLCWGDASVGQLGDGAFVGRGTPAEVDGLGDVTALAALDFHTCALTREGRVFCWGEGEEGQLGNGQQKTSAVPVEALLP